MWTYLLIALCIGLVIGLTATRLALSKRLNHIEQINQKVREENQKIQEELDKNKQENWQVQIDLEAARNFKKHIDDDIIDLQEKLLKKQDEADSSVQDYYIKHLTLAKERFANDLEKLEENYNTAEQEYQHQYLIALTDAAKDFQYRSLDIQKQLNELNETLDDTKSKVAAAVEANKRAAEAEQKKDFYRLVLSKIDIEEITKLREVAQYLRNSEPLNKVIWKVYYERPYTDLIGRVIGSGVHCGIYKITNIDNGMCYVGQAVNIADRWKQHIKRGIGADPPTRNKLYPAMLASGVENFTFEIVEECDRTKLNEREIYWQEFFKAKEFGYSIK